MSKKTVNANCVSDYLSLFREMSYPFLFSRECVQALDAVEKVYGSTLSHQVIFEVHLNDDSRTTDFSFCVDEPDGSPVHDRWLEFDYETYAGPESLIPCVFLDASALGNPEGSEYFCGTALPGLTGAEKADIIVPALKNLCSCPEIKGGLFQVGSMDSRKPSDSVRIYTNDLDSEQVISVLEFMNWPGDSNKLSAWLGEWSQFAAKGLYNLSFDLFSDRISEKIGIEFQPRTKLPKTMDTITDYLMEKGFCRQDKAESLCGWVRELPLGAPYIQNDVSHIKFTIEQGQPSVVKAYLRQSDELKLTNARWFRKPLQMNLELTTKCPLRCPQCYVHLNTGEELPLEEALYWLSEGKRAGVRHVNLSGGETLSYPYIIDLLRECKRLGLVSNIALSGAYVNRTFLKEIIDAGADMIFVSLNGSTEEINRKSRDGFKMAVYTLELLKEFNFPNTVINFVMQRSNADDIPSMISLAERYGVQQLTILGFKPDSSYQLSAFPTAEQLTAAAKIIKQYKGPVVVDAEPCFSQLRSLVGKTFFINRNMGIFRGCGAGRDGISVNVHGKLTPCRHLDVPEDYRSIPEYWQNSPFLKELRSVEDNRSDPCKNCELCNSCLPCMAVGVKLHGEIRTGMEECPLGKDVKIKDTGKESEK